MHPTKLAASTTLILIINSHLLNKIQALGKAALFGKRETVNDQPAPAPVKRRLIL